MSEHQHFQILNGINNQIFIIHNTAFPHRSQISSVSHYSVSIVSLESRATSRLYYLIWIYQRFPDGSKSVLCVWRTVLFCWVVSFFKPITLDARRHADEVREPSRGQKEERGMERETLSLRFWREIKQNESRRETLRLCSEWMHSLR